MATFVPAKRAVAYTTYVSLVSRTNRPSFQTNPTLAAGDVKVSKDGGALANITTLPTVSPAAGVQVKVDLSGTEMTADYTTVIFQDAAGAEWDDLLLVIPTTARQIDDLAFPAVSGRSLVVDANGRVDLSAWLGAAVNALIAGRVDANAQVVGDKTGYALAAAEYTALVNLIWDELTTEGRVANSYGQLFKDNLNAAITSRAAPGAAMALVVNAVDALALATDAVDEIWAAVLSELPQAAPAATPTARAALMLLYMMARNANKSTSTERRVVNDVGTVIAKATMSDDGTTFDQGELTAGP